MNNLIQEFENKVRRLESKKMKYNMARCALYISITLLIFHTGYVLYTHGSAEYLIVSLSYCIIISIIYINVKNENAV